MPRLLASDRPVKNSYLYLFMSVFYMATICCALKQSAPLCILFLETLRTVLVIAVVFYLFLRGKSACKCNIRFWNTFRNRLDWKEPRRVPNKSYQIHSRNEDDLRWTQEEGGSTKPDCLYKNVVTYNAIILRMSTQTLQLLIRRIC